MGNVIILEETTKNPITLIGKRAGVCWGADITSDEKTIGGVWIVLCLITEEHLNT